MKRSTKKHPESELQGEELVEQGQSNSYIGTSQPQISSGEDEYPNDSAGFPERVKLAMEKSDIKTFKKLAVRAGVSENSLNLWLKHGKPCRGSSRLALALALNVSAE